MDFKIEFGMLQNSTSVVSSIKLNLLITKIGGVFESRCSVMLQNNARKVILGSLTF